MDNTSTIQAVISGDPVRWRLLKLVHDLNLADCWIGAGFVRNAVWDHLHGRDSSPLLTNVDVIWFDAGHCTSAGDRGLEVALRKMEPASRRPPLAPWAFFDL